MAELDRNPLRYAGVLAALVLSFGLAACDDEGSGDETGEQPAESTDTTG